MTWELCISPDGWTIIWDEVMKKSRNWLISALADSMYQRMRERVPDITEVALRCEKANLILAMRKLPKDLLEDMTVGRIQETRSTSNGGRFVYVDAAGNFTIDLNNGGGDDEDDLESERRAE